MHAYIHIHNHSKSHYTHASDWMLNSSWKELNCNMQSSQVHALMMACKVSAGQSATGARQVSPTHVWSNQDPCYHMRPATITMNQLSPISTTLPTSNPRPPKKSVGKEFKMKSEIDLRHSCYQSAMIWWSTRSSACRWRVGEWRPIVNMSADSNRQPG